MNSKLIGVALALVAVLAGCGKKEAATPGTSPTSAISASSTLGGSTEAASSIAVYVPNDGDQIVKVVRLEATGATEAGACNQIIDNGTRAASNTRTGWGLVSVKGGGACACEKKEGFYACARDVYLGKLSTDGQSPK